LIDAAARLLVEEGPAALSARRLAREVGTSTIAIYTYFEGMDDLRAAVAAEGFVRLARHLSAVRRTSDPVADVAAFGTAYVAYGVRNPDLYRFTFQQHRGHEPTDVHGDDDAFGELLDAVQRAVDSGRFSGDTGAIALQLWATTHGLTSLHLAGLLSLEDAAATLEAMGPALFAGFGDTPAAAEASVSAAAQASPLAKDEPTGPPDAPTSGA
jgi:AcrR family transcriptional regulator